MTELAEWGPIIVAFAILLAAIEINRGRGSTHDKRLNFDSHNQDRLMEVLQSIDRRLDNIDQNLGRLADKD